MNTVSDSNLEDNKELLISFQNDLSQELNKNEILQILPNIETVVTSFQTLGEGGFCCEIRVAIKTKEEALKWLEDFQNKSFTTYKVAKTYEENSLKIVFKRSYHCLHNTRPSSHGSKSPHQKHTNCPARLTISVKQTGMKRSKDVYLKKLPCHISIYYKHNHNIFTTFRYRKPSIEIEEKIKDLFSKGHSPSSALEMFKIELQEKHKDNYDKMVAYKSKCPTKKWCYDLHCKVFKKKYEKPSGPELIESLHDFIKRYNEECSDECAVMVQNGDDMVIAICSPFMKRVHKYINSSSEILYIDSSGEIDKQNSRFFLLLCPTAVGALPLGIIITCSESEENVFKGLELYKKLLNDYAFYGTQGPNIIITDDSIPERRALKRCFPNAILLLSEFHVLQSLMCYLWDSKHSIQKDDKIDIYKIFNKLVKYETEELLLEHLNIFLNSDVVQKYPDLLRFIDNLIQRSHKWAFCYNPDIIYKENNINNFTECNFRILKDNILHGTKAFSFTIVQILDYLTKSLESYYERKLTNIINNRTEYFVKSRYFIENEKIQNLKCVQLDENLYEVTSGEDVYFVDNKIDICSCVTGKHGAPCKHQFVITKQFNILSNKIIPKNDPELISLLYKMLKVEEVTITDWFNNTTSNESQNKPIIVGTDTNEILNMNFDAEVCENTAITTLNEISTSEIVEECNKLQNCLKTLSKKVNETPDLFYEPIKKFNELFISITTDNALISALNTFGKCSGAEMPVLKSKKILQGSSKRNIQLVARKTPLKGINVYAGGPAKNKDEHNYHKKRQLIVTDLSPSKKKCEAPLEAAHLLSHCVDSK